MSKKKREHVTFDRMADPRRRLGRGELAGRPGAPPPGERTPGARPETARAALLRRLLEGPATARELSAAAGIREKDVADHLAHLARSLAGRGERLVTAPASCIACGFTFRDRTRLQRPGSCPQCRSTRIDPPVFHVEAAGGGRGEGDGEAPAGSAGEGDQDA